MILFALVAAAAVVTYLLAMAICPIVWPEWTAGQRWYPANTTVLRRYGYAMSPTAHRFYGVFMLMGILLLALSLAPDPISQLAMRSFLGLWAVGAIFGFIRTVAPKILPAAVLADYPWLSGGLTEVGPRPLWRRILEGLSVTLCAALGLLLLLVLCLTSWR